MALFTKRLAETIAWCALCGDAADPTKSLRTAALHPGNRQVDEKGEVDYHWNVDDSRQALATLAEVRAKSLHRAGRAPALLPQALAGGRLLVCEPEASVWDGLSEDWSQGFFDVVDVPPWDTWIGLFYVPSAAGRQWEHLYLLSWVPSAFVEMASEGISVNCVSCISWASDETTAFPFLSELRQAGLMV